MGISKKGFLKVIFKPCVSIKWWKELWLETCNLQKALKNISVLKRLRWNAGTGYIRSKGSVASKGLKYHDYSVYNSRFFILTCLRLSLSQFTGWKQGKIHKNRSKKAIIYNILLRDFAVSNAEKVLIALLNTKQSVPSRHCLFGDCSKIKSKWRDLWRASVKLKRSFFFSFCVLIDTFCFF